MIRFGANPIAWSNDDDQSLGAEIPLEQCLREAGEIGFDGIENGHKMPWGADDLKAALTPHGLAFVSAWWSLELLSRSAEEEIIAITPHLDRLEAMGCTVCIVCETSNAIHGQIGTPIAQKPVIGSDDAWAEFGARVERVAQHCQERGLPLVYHHHMGTVVQTPEEIDRLMEVTGPSTWLLFDTGHCYFGGGDPEVVLAKHADRVLHFHAKNVRPDVMARMQAENLSFLDGVRLGVFTVPGDPEGCVAFEPCLRLLKQQDYQGWLVIEAEQDPAVRVPLKYQTMGLSALRRMAAESGLIAGQTPGAHA